MPARTGEQYIDRLKAKPPNLWIRGERVKDPTEHPAFRNVTRSVAALYDMQHDPTLVEEMTYPSPTTGERVGISFLHPKIGEDLARRSRMMKRWADYSLGMLGRSPDYLNVALMACASASDYFAQNDPRHGENIRAYYELVRENDLCLTHALTNPQVNRAAGVTGQPEPYIPVGVVSQNKNGVVVRGARMLATLPVADEIMIFPSTLIRAEEGAEKYALAFAIPTSTPGLTFLCRESLDLGRPQTDHPLGSRFEEMDAMVIFDDVLVPWERIFILGDIELCNNLFKETNAVLHMAHQVVVNKIAKTEAILGVSMLMVETVGADQFPHVQEKIAEMITYLEALRAFRRTSEVDASLDRYGVMCPARGPLDASRNLYPRLYPRIIEIVQLLGASGLILLPSTEDLNSEVAPYIDRYLQGRSVTARERIPLFRLAWDLSVSAFGARQVLYERFFFGDPVRMMSTLYQVYDKEPYKELIRRFLDRNSENPASQGGNRDA
ncbi:MAG: 4-hydroxyphenylacetate 3-monooxygenase, oxygenase component [Candidatus Tectomicrobia bacterium]|nr:4-hydroxyphenylacetate 3-monooxygenase, oxygenase component [Candidatus Tectomicrobia bacterium]